ncbi:MAG: hypothetical protein AB1861_04315 [Cyanobacteriota bacterium]
MTENDLLNKNMNCHAPDVRQIFVDINTRTGALLLDTIYIAILNIHCYSPLDQKKILVIISKNIQRLDDSDKLWVAKMLKNAYLLISNIAVKEYFCLLYEIEQSLVEGNYDVKLLAELIEQLGRLFKMYPFEEKSNIMAIFAKYLISGVTELIAASCESIEMALHDLTDEQRYYLLASLKEAGKQTLEQDIARDVGALTLKLSWNNPPS